MISEADVWARLDGLAKPRRSLGELEGLAVQLALTQCCLQPVTRPRRIVLFAADHGVVEAGVSAWPSAVTAMMVNTILAGRATSSALARAHDCPLRLVDVGVAGEPPDNPPEFYRHARIAPGSANLAQGAALTEQQFEVAWKSVLTKRGARFAMALGFLWRVRWGSATRLRLPPSPRS